MKKLALLSSFILLVCALGSLPAPKSDRYPVIGELLERVSPLSPVVNAQRGTVVRYNSLYQGLVAYWSMDEASGTRNASFGAASLPLTDNNSVGNATGKVGNAGQFNTASSRYLSSSDNATLSMGDIDFTIAAWVYFDSHSGARFIFQKGVSIGPSTDEYGLYYASAPQRFRMRVSNGSTRANADDTTALSDSTWYFVVGSYDAANNLISIQVNNNTATTASHSGGAQDNTGTFYIGQSGNNDSYQDGRIDIAMMWKRLLTASEKTYLYNSGNGRAPL